MSIPSFVLVQGAITGLGYGLLAMGLVLIYRTNRVLNFAQGQLGVVAAVFLVKCFYDFGFNYWFSLVLALGLAAAVGALSELVLRRLFNRPRVLVMVATIGLSQVLFVFTALPFLRPQNLFKPFPVPVRPHLPHRHLPVHAGPGPHAHRGADRRRGACRVRPVVAVGTRHAGDGRERGVGPPVGRLGPSYLDDLLDPRRRALRVRRDPRVARSGIRADRGAQPRAAPAGAHRGDGRRDGQPAGRRSSPAIAVGVVQEILVWNLATTAQVDLVLFLIVSAVLLVRVAALRIGVGGRSGPAGWRAPRSRLRDVDPLRRRVGRDRCRVGRGRGRPRCHWSSAPGARS